MSKYERKLKLGVSFLIGVVIIMLISACNTTNGTLAVPIITGVPEKAGMIGEKIVALDRQDANAVLQAVINAFKNKDTTAFTTLVENQGLFYAFFFEGGDPTTKQDFINDLKTRLASGSKCEGYSIAYDHIMVWTSGWSPAWKMTEKCYGGCEPITPPYESKIAGFYFWKQTDGWILKSVFLKDRKTWEQYGGAEKVYSCSSLPAPVITFSCPGGLPTRLKINDLAYVNTTPPLANNVRELSSKRSNKIGEIKPGKTMRILEGPQCGDGMIWWKVKAIKAPLKGWTAEGDAKNYWLVPCASEASCGK